jgi:hypothetical protein
LRGEKWGSTNHEGREREGIARVLQSIGLEERQPPEVKEGTHDGLSVGKERRGAEAGEDKWDIPKWTVNILFSTGQHSQDVYLDYVSWNFGLKPKSFDPSSRSTDPPSSWRPNTVLPSHGLRI